MADEQDNELAPGAGPTRRRSLRLVPPAAPAAGTPSPLDQWVARKAYDIGVEALGWAYSRDEPVEDVSAALRQIAGQLWRRADMFDPRPSAAAVEEVRLAVRQALAGR